MKKAFERAAKKFSRSRATEPEPRLFPSLSGRVRTGSGLPAGLTPVSPCSLWRIAVESGQFREPRWLQGQHPLLRRQPGHPPALCQGRDRSTSSTSTRPSTPTRTTTSCSRRRTAAQAVRARSAPSRTHGHGAMEDEAVFADLVDQMAAQIADCLQAFRTLLGAVRHARLPRHDGPSPRRASPGYEANGEHLPPLRPCRQPLPQDCSWTPIFGTRAVHATRSSGKAYASATGAGVY
ncbi:MAG: hypothetical protein M0C28_02910 [Candidatus Moduliflexus flocculans]|nr:hypothetical protein [Candidatus Moduliflexus flocculans]